MKFLLLNFLLLKILLQKTYISSLFSFRKYGEIKIEIMEKQKEKKNKYIKNNLQNIFLACGGLKLYHKFHQIFQLLQKKFDKRY